ncbi:MAG: ABC transporter substrate-binding protein [Clostridia bacterium]|nr:ABC transporter substrate-binding protein [Clostridia bacterium]
MKKFAAILLTLCLVLSLTSFAVAEEAINVYALKGPTGIGLVKVMNDNDGTYNITLAGAPDEVTAAVINGDANIAAVPTNLAATLYNKTQGKVQLVALNTLGVLHIVTSDPTIQSLSDLEGKTLWATGQGSTPEYVLNYILEANGLADKVEVQYLAEHAELATQAASGMVDVALLPEPHVTSVLNQNKDFRIALDVTELFNQAAAGKGENAVLSMGCVIVNKEWAENNADKLAAFMDAYAASVEFVNTNVDEASQMVEAQGIIPKAAVAKKAIPNCHIVFVTGEEMKTQIAPFFQVLYNANPKSVGGALPVEDFYYIAK